MRGKLLMLCKACFIDHLSMTAVSGKSPAGSDVGAVRKGLEVSHAVSITASSNRKSSGENDKMSSRLLGDVESIDCALGGVCCRCRLT